MNRRELVAGGILLLGSQAAPVAAAPEDEAALKEAMKRYYSVFYKDRDQNRYRALLADDYRLLENGELLTVEEDIAFMPKPEDRYERSDGFDFQLAGVSGTAAYLVYFLSSEIDDARGHRSARFLESAVFRRSGAMWLLSVLHSTKIMPAGN
jgi:hypothetical protein